MGKNNYSAQYSMLGLDQAILEANGITSEMRVPDPTLLQTVRWPPAIRALSSFFKGRANLSVGEYQV